MPDPTRGTLVIRRRRGFFDAWRSYQVMIDGHPVGSVRSGTSESFGLAAGSHEAQLRIDWTGSKPVTFVVEPGGETALLVEYEGKLLGRTKVPALSF